LYKCARTATVKSKLYSTIGRIEAGKFTDLVQTFPLFRRHLCKVIQYTYDDDLKIFLMESLKRIDYLAKVKDSILIEICYNMLPEIKEKGSILYKADVDEEEMVTDEMVIIFDGSIEIYTITDNGSEFSFEILPTGSILNPNNFLTDRKHVVNYRCLANCLLYKLSFDQLYEIAKNDNDFQKDVVKYKGQAEANKNRD
jgi:CRP-like cAMP-binding protein